jgi:hypothetical protein
MSLLDALDKLPPYGGITFRGIPIGASAPPHVSVATGLIPTTTQVQLASENFTAAWILALLNRTARDISILSAASEEHEVVIRPGTAWSRLFQINVQGCRIPVLVLEELQLSDDGAQPLWGDTSGALAQTITQQVQQALALPPSPIRMPGRFCSEWPAQEYIRKT